MATGSEISSSNKRLSFSLLNLKTKLIDTGGAINSATKTGAGQEGYCTSTASGFNLGANIEINETNQVWIPKQAATMYNVKWGSLIPRSSTYANNLDGIFTRTTSTGSVALASFSTTDGDGLALTSGAVAGNQAGYNMGATYTVRNFNPTLRLRFKISSSSTNTRLFIGFNSSTSLVGNTDDPLNALSGFALGKTTTSANFRIFSNDGTGATVDTDTTIAVDTNVHEFDIFADTAGSKWWWVLDRTTSGSISTASDIPAATTALSTQSIITTNETAAKTLTVYNAYLSTNK